ncbi:MAG TPA: DUF3300 domain-containing protein [Burkholderiales bacterium]|nr:DUF3300 domain-containing protein [Burkholderiales bacterium]
MKRLLAFIAFVCLAVPAQARVYNQAELDALVAPIALYPDSLLSQILMAATYPEEVAEAARWSRANAHLKGEEAVSAAQNEPWDPSVKSLLAFPEVLARMDESPRWTRELGEAFLGQEPHVMDTVQGLRKRAQASGHLQNEQNSVRQEGQDIVIQPAQPNVVYVPYYDPYVVYGPWWWHAYRPVHWSPWYAPPVFVSSVFFGGFNWPHRHVHVVRRPVFVKHTHLHVVPGKWQHRPTKSVSATVSQFQRVPESRRQPIINSTPRNASEAVRTQGMPAASRFSNDQPRRDVQRVEPRREAPRGESRRQPISRSTPQLPAAASASVPGFGGQEVKRVLPAPRLERQEQRSAGREVHRVEPRRSASAAVREHRGR